jgi:phage antirepressor YoqD-like protein
MEIEVEEIFSTKEIAVILKINQTAVRLLIKDGKLKANNISRGKQRPVWKITQTQLIEYLRDNNIKYTDGQE